MAEIKQDGYPAIVVVGDEMDCVQLWQYADGGGDVILVDRALLVELARVLLEAAGVELPGAEHQGNKQDFLPIKQ